MLRTACIVQQLDLKEGEIKLNEMFREQPIKLDERDPTQEWFGEQPTGGRQGQFNVYTLLLNFVKLLYITFKL